jgi:very-short-patch-repair endonuclease/prophage antirepressor-like protein/transposase
MSKKDNLNVYYYTENNNNFTYFVAFEIANLLGYNKLGVLITKYVSEQNKIIFREFKGNKDPYLDPRTILITKEGVNQLLNSIKNKSNDTIKKTLIKYNIIEKVNKKDDSYKLTTYSYTSDNLHYEYFVANEISNMLGYKNINQIVSKNVSEDNKIIFKNYKGNKEPYLNPNTILITKEGINEILNSTRKCINDISKQILIKYNIIEDESYEEKDELTTYSYISNGLYFEYFVGYEISALLGYKNVNQAISNNVSKCNRLVFKDYPGPKYPNLEPLTILITRDGVCDLLIKTRKRLTPDVLHILKKFQIETTNKKCLTKEQQTLSAIANAFKTEKVEDQVPCGSYFLDMYFPEYKIVVECDENGHSDRKPCDERERMDFVNQQLNIDDENWIRFNPDEHDFDISKVIGKIYRFIKQKENEKIINEENNKSNLLLIEENEKLKRQDTSRQTLMELLNKYSNINEEEKKNMFKLEVQPISGKYLAPNKEFLISLLRNNSITKVAQMFKISTKPVNKWIEEYDIDVKNIDVHFKPPKDELLNFLKKSSLAHVSHHYGFSKHLIKKWLKSYNLTVGSIKKNKKPIDKKDILNTLEKYENNLDKTSEYFNISIEELNRLMCLHSIEKIPSKKELEENLVSKSKEDLASLYNTTRTTLRKWIEAYNLQHIRCKVKTNRKIVSIKNNISVEYDSIKEAGQKLKMSANTIRDKIKLGEIYQGYVFKCVT